MTSVAHWWGGPWLWWGGNIPRYIKEFELETFRVIETWDDLNVALVEFFFIEFLSSLLALFDAPLFELWNTLDTLDAQDSREVLWKSRTFESKYAGYENYENPR